MATNGSQAVFKYIEEKKYDTRSREVAAYPGQYSDFESCRSQSVSHLIGCVHYCLSTQDRERTLLLGPKTKQRRNFFLNVFFLM